MRGVRKTALTILAVLSALSVFLAPFLLRVQIDCKSQYGECPPEINSKLQALNSKNLLQAKKGIRKTLKDNLLISDFSIQLKLPDILEVNLLIKKPSFALKDKDTGKIIAVSESGMILAAPEDTSLPVVVSHGVGNIGESISSPDLFALGLMNGIFDMYQVSAGEIVDDRLVVELPGQIRVILPLEGDKDVLLGSLRLIYTKIRSEEGLGYSEIDLRFKNPVLR